MGGLIVVVACGVWLWGLPWWPWEGGLVVVCVGGGWRWWGLVGIPAWCVSGLVPGGGAGRDGVGGHCWWRGGRGWVLCWVGV